MFWARAEILVQTALDRFVAFASNGRRLNRELLWRMPSRVLDLWIFFVVALMWYSMNPPFGEAIPSQRNLMSIYFPSSSQDLGMAFVDRGHELLEAGGFVGAITTRIFIANERLSEWRHEHLLGKKSTLVRFADLGFKVLDEATVEVSAYVMSQLPSFDRTAVFHNVLSSIAKDDALLRIIQAGVESRLQSAYAVDFFLKVPAFVLCYWLPSTFLNACLGLANIQADGSPARVGLQTGDNHRFVRAAWEVSPQEIGRDRTWSYFAKGGEYEPYYDDIHLVVFWKDNGSSIKSFVDSDMKLLSRPQNEQYYYREGITYPDRTTSDFSPRIMPPGIIFSSTGFAIIPKNRAYLLGYLGAAYTRPFKVIVEAFVGSGDTANPQSAARHYRPGVLNVLPNLLREATERARNIVVSCIHARIELFSIDETTRYFQTTFSQYKNSRISEMAFDSYYKFLNECCDLIYSSYELEAEVLQNLGGEVVARSFDELYGKHPATYSEYLSQEDMVAACESLMLDEIALVLKARELLGASRQIMKKSFIADRKLELVCHMFGASPRTIASAFAKYGSATEEATADLTRRILSFSVLLILKILYAVHDFTTDFVARC